MTQPGWGWGAWGQQAWGGPDSGASTDPPEFAGIKYARMHTFTSVQIGWDAAIDDITSSDIIIYKIYKKLENQSFDYGTVYATVVGVTSYIDSSDVVPGTTYCYAVRAQDSDGNTDTNTAERCVPIVVSHQDATRFRKTYSYYRQEGQYRPASTQDMTRWRKTYSFLRQQPRLNSR